MSKSGRDPYLEFWSMTREDSQGFMPLVYCIGQVLEATPEHIRVWADGHELAEEDLLINAALRPDFTEAVMLDAMSGRLNGLSSMCPLGPAHTYFDVADVSNGASMTYRAPMRLSAGDLVLLIPDRDRQIYYLMTKVVRWHESVPLN